MWVSREIAESGDGFKLRVGRVTIGGDSPGVDAEGELHDSVVVVPPGFSVTVASGGSAVVGDLEGDTALLGAPSGECAAKKVVIRAGDAALELSEDGISATYGSARLVMGRTSVSLRFGTHGFVVTGGGAYTV